MTNLPPALPNALTKSVVRVLYVHSNIDEKSSSSLLEEVTRKYLHSPFFVFTCVTHSFMAMECNSMIQFDLLIIEKDLPHLNGLEMMNIFYHNGCNVPVIFLINREDAKDMVVKFPADVIVEWLADPYTPLELCSTISKALHRGKTYVRFHRHVPPPSPSNAIAVSTAMKGRNRPVSAVSSPRLPPPIRSKIPAGVDNSPVKKQKLVHDHHPQQPAISCDDEIVDSGRHNVYPTTLQSFDSQSSAHLPLSFVNETDLLLSPSEEEKLWDDLLAAMSDDI